MKWGLGTRDSGLGRTMLILLCWGGLLACSPKVPRPSKSFLPDNNEAPGWVKTSETRTFAADELWKYLDGDAEKYLRAGVQKTLTSDYRYREKIEATADIHAMRSSEGARKVFESEVSLGSQPLAIGDAGRISKGTLAFREGPFFVRLVAYQDAPEANEALIVLARAIEKRLALSKPVS